MNRYVLIFLMLCNYLSGQIIEPMATDRPDQTECANTVPKGFFQMENGFMIENDFNQNLKTKETVFVSSLLKFGISQNLELRLIIENSTLQTHGDTHFSELNGFNPTQIGLKLGLLKGNGLIPKTSLIMHSVMPKWASDNKKINKLSYNFRFAMQHELSDKSSFGYNIGSEYDSELRQNNLIYTISTCRQLAKRVGAYIELYGAFSKTTEPQLSFDGGFTFPVRPNLMFDISASKGLSTSAPNNYFSMGFSFRLPK